MSSNRISPESSDGSPMEAHPLQPLGDDAQIPPPAYSPQNNEQAPDEDINFGETKVHEPTMPTVTDPENDGNYDLPGSVTHSRESMHNSRESGIHSRESVTRSRESIQQSRESLKQMGEPAGLSHDPIPASPDHLLPPMPEPDTISEHSVNAYKPILPRESSNLGEVRYESPPPYTDNSTAGSRTELLPSEKMVPLSPIGNNKVGPVAEQQAQVYAGSSSEHPAPVYAGASSDYPRRSLSRQISERDLIHKDIRSDDNTDGAGCCGWLLYVFSILLIVVTLPFSLMFTIKVVQEYERAVIFRLGRLPSGGAKGPGIFFIIPCIESYSKVDLRTVSFDVPPQEVLTKDSVTVSVDAVVYYRVSNPTVSVANVENAHHSTRLLAQTTLRNILGTKNMSEILSDREAISHGMQSTLDEATDRWGIKVERVEIKDVRLPVQLQRAMAAEAEAAREARAKVIAAEGEQKASKALKEAADVMCQSSAALQLRYLQTLNSISAEKNSTIIFPLPVDMISSFLKR